jgi:hypothetical protein
MPGHERFQIITGVLLNSQVFSDIITITHRSVNGCQRFEELKGLHLQSQTASLDCVTLGQTVSLNCVTLGQTLSLDCVTLGQTVSLDCVTLKIKLLQNFETAGTI